MDAADDIIGLYTRHGPAWARDRGDAVTFEAAWLARFLALLPPAGRVLDIGCGSGAPIAAAIAAAGHRVTGLDASPTLLALARARLPQAEWIEADMRAMALHRRFDGLVAWDSFFHLDHAAQRGMFPRFATHAAPGAPLLFTSGPRHGVAMGTYAGEPLFHASLDAEEYRALLAAQGFAVLDHRPEDPATGGRTVWLARRA
ncbi:class I SAM-dependent methyltransferase [Roseomonas sp. PWR1]|uniref:Class I SAM-dependent methyltransferase n=1 Tax=Roseomonas nitratireducens TaxID=2820810 RepID=A0ABS4AM74_9PROT|nr:class I SAM-dependent methyltransferase [Neoroseomonas nitratireducens]MBP0462467.1 class I SAM-dependent methyltransferase [Neoroseomonas nitratireducens]